MKLFLKTVVAILIASGATAMPLDIDNPTGIAAVYAAGTDTGAGTTFAVCVDGTGYRFVGVSLWLPFTPSPVPLAEVADWTPWVIRTNDGRRFFRPYAHDDAVYPWRQIGFGVPAPGCSAAIKADAAPLGDIKSRYR